MKPLEGIKVVEFATYVVIPTAARVLADWGADVIKVEGTTGDPWRIQGRAYGLPTKEDCNPLYAVTNAGKRYVSLDLKTPEGKEALFKMLETADVFMTNIRLGGIQRLGLDWKVLHQKFPKLVYVHFDGFGDKGPDKDRPGFDNSAFWCASGMYHDLHEPGMRPPPMTTGVGDTASSNAVVSGLLAALLCRDRTGEGMFVTSSLLANGIWCNHSNIVGMQEREDGTVPPELPRRADDTRNPFSHIYECSDGEWIVLVGSSAFRKDPAAALRAVGLGEYAQDSRYNSVPFLPENARALYQMFVAQFKSKSSAEWDELLTKADISHQILAHSCDVTKSEQAWANDYLTLMECPNGNSYVVPNSPVSFGGAERTHTKHVGAFGCDTSEVLKEYGYGAEEIEEMMKTGIIAGK